MARWLVTRTGHAGGMHQYRGGRGSVSVELAILTPAMLLLILLAIVTGRSESAYNAITMAAADAARAASISRTAQQAADRAVAVAHTTLADQGLTCQQLQVDPDVSQFSHPPGQPAQVTVTVVCQLTFGDLGLGFDHQLQASFVSVIDRWRGRSP